MLRFREYVALNERLGVPDAVVKALPVFMARIREILDETERAFRELQSSYGRDPLVSLNVPGMPSEIRLNMTVDTRARRDAVQAGGSWRGGKKPVLSVFVSLKETSVLLKDRDFVESEIEGVLLHELTHAHEDTVRPGGLNSDVEVSLVWLNRSDNEELGEALRVMYLSTSFEVAARVPQVLADIRATGAHKLGTRGLESAIKNSRSWKVAEEMERFSADLTMRRLVADGDQWRARRFFEIAGEMGPKRLDDRLDQLAQDLSKPGEEALLRAALVQSYAERKRVFSMPLEDILKWIERRAHRAAKKLKRKLLKVAAYAADEL